MQAQESKIDNPKAVDTALPSASVGVLFIHGIGNQQRGDTLFRFGVPLSRWINSWRGGSTTVNIAARIVDASLREADDPVAPAHAVLRIGHLDSQLSNGKDRCRHWLMAESNWEETFVPPTYAQVAKWAVELFPWAVASHFGERMQRRIRTAEFSGHDLVNFVRSTGNLISASLYLALGLCLTPMIVALMLIMLVLGLVPISWFRSAVGSFQRTLASVIGDSFTLLDNEIQEAAIVGRVRRDLRWLSNRCDKVALIAHSQGAAIAHKVVRSLAEEGSHPPELLITFGSGIKKLVGLRSIRESELKWSPYLVLPGLVMSAASFFDVAVSTFQQWRFGLAMISMSIVVLAVGLGIDKMREIRRSKKEVRKFEIISLSVVLCFAAAIGCLGLILGPAFLEKPFSVLALIIGLVFIYLGIKPILRKAKIDLNAFAVPEQTSWFDYFASEDPVPNGALVESGDYSVSWPRYTGGKRVVTESASLLDRDDDFLLPQEINSRIHRDRCESELMRFARICNRESALTDHLTYWKNTEEFVGPIACALARLDGFQLVRTGDQDGRRLEVAKHRRRWRVKCLRYIAVFFVTLVGVVLIGMWRVIPESFQDAPQIMLWIASALQSALSQVPILKTIGPNIPIKFIFVAMVVCLGAIGYLVARAIWLLWEWADTDRYLTRKRFEPAPPAVKALLLLGILMVNATWLVIGGSEFYFFKAVGLAAIVSPIVAGVGIRGLVAFSVYIPAFAIVMMNIKAEQTTCFFNSSMLTLVIATFGLFVLWLIGDSRIGHIVKQRIDGISGSGNVHAAYARLFGEKERQQSVLSEYLKKIAQAIEDAKTDIEQAKAARGFFRKIGAWITKIDAKSLLSKLKAQKEELEEALGHSRTASRAELIKEVLLKLLWFLAVSAVMIWGTPLIL